MITALLFHPSGLPLIYDIEVPLHSNTVFIVGARPTEQTYDLNFVGSLAGVVLTPHVAPDQFSGCVRQCLETITVDTTGTSVIASEFNRQARTIDLYGPASPIIFQSVLQTVTYTNLNPDINVAAILVQVNDGIGSTTIEIPVTEGMMRKRRSIVNRPIRHLLSITEETSKAEEKVSPNRDSFSFYWPLAAVAVSTLAIAMAILRVWSARYENQAQNMV